MPASAFAGEVEKRLSFTYSRVKYTSQSMLSNVRVYDAGSSLTFRGTVNDVTPL